MTRPHAIEAIQQATEDGLLDQTPAETPDLAHAAEALGEVIDGEPVLAVVPYSGEALPINQLPVQALAKALDEARQFERDLLAAFKREVQDEVLARMDAAVATGTADSWTWHVDGYKIIGDTPDQTDFPVDQVKATLARLIADGTIDEHWLVEVIVPERWKVAKRPLQRLLKLGGPAAEALKALEVPRSRPRSVRVEVSGNG